MTASRQQKWYWVCQAIGWTCYLFIGLLMSFLFFKKQAGMYAVQFVGTAMFFGTTHLQRHLHRKHRWLELPLGKMVLLVLAYNAVASITCQLLVCLFMLSIGMFTLKEFSFGYLVMYSANGLVILSFWSTIYFAFQAIQRWKEKEVEAWKLQLSLKEAELQAIRSQLNPHFLFNSLNNIRSLVLVDQTKAREMITRLSAMMRYVIGYNRNNLVSVAEELGFLDHYVALEKIHFEDKLHFSSQVEASVKNAAIPPLGIQLLVENAIKHGIGTQAKGGKIQLSLHRKNGHLRVQVENTGILDASSASTGIGLQRLLERVAHSLDQPGTFNLSQTSDNSVTATLTLPWKDYENLHR
ncbi:sensor histidine kinase [Rufibacter aurantiacus]|uniref:sensor histidine kinase n=1 Tax=Rufibacter aurantiacus TaxID=2817374 RepID=UPI001B3188C5|nr:histidine kinase [Rufibacter aurantiacus]